MPAVTYTELKETQILVEEAFSRKGIKARVLEYMGTIPECEIRIDQGVELLRMWCESESAYESKQTRKDHISQMDLRELTTEIYVRIASLTSETTLNNLASQLAGILGFADTRVGIQACAEVIAILCDTNFFNLTKYHINSSIYVSSNFALPDELNAYIERACYLPPMVVKPKKLRDNRSSGYLTVKGDSLILGGGHNHHNDHIALDVLDLMNGYELCLNEFILNNVEEEPTHDLDVVEQKPDQPPLTEIEKQRAIMQQKNNWNKHLSQCDYFYKHILLNNNKMYITNKFDKRGRIYSQGHHINPQGTSYKKACIDLFNKEVVAIPDNYFNQG